MNEIDVAVVILNWNGKKLLEKFLPSVIATSYPHTQIIIADNASTDDSIAFVKAHFKNVKIIANEKNEGFAKGYNTVLKQVKADIFVLLNSDVEVTPGWIEPIVGLFKSDEKIGACQPKILNEINKNSFDYAGAAGGWIDYLGYPLAKGRVFDHLETDKHQYEGNYEVFWASGAALFVRSTVYNELNGLDESFFAHQEEIDFCWRVQLSGYKVMSCTQSVVYHVGGATLQQGSPQKTYLNFRNNLMMLSKNLPFTNGIKTIAIRLSLDGVAAWRFLLKGQVKHFIAIARSHVSFVYRRLFEFKKHSLPKKPLNQLTGVISKSIVWQYYVKNKKTFTEISDN